MIKLKERDKKNCSTLATVPASDCTYFRKVIVDSKLAIASYVVAVVGSEYGSCKVALA